MEEQEKLMKPEKLPSGFYGRIIGFEIVWDKAEVEHIPVVVIDNIRGRGSERAQGKRSLRFDEQFKGLDLLRSDDRIEFNARISKGKSRFTHVSNVRKYITPQTKLDDFSDGDKEHDK